MVGKLTPWKIPSFLKSCDIVCFLERDFPIIFHTPLIPREVLASGSCLVCSKEITDKQLFRDNLVDGKNFVLIDDPKDRDTLTNKLRDLLDDKKKTKTIGKHGFYLSESFESELADIKIEDFLC